MTPQEIYRQTVLNARAEFPIHRPSVLSMDQTEYALHRAHECANDLLDRLIAGADFDTLLQIRTAADDLMVKFAAVSATAQQRAVDLTHKEG